MYDTVGKLRWAVDVRTHTIKDVITRVIELDLEGGWEENDEEDEEPDSLTSSECVWWWWWWPGNKCKDKDKDRKKGRDVPLAREEVDCIDCYKWEFGDFKEKDHAILLTQS